MSTEKMREEFEAWYLGKFCGEHARLFRFLNADQAYYLVEVQSKWDTWQASRAAIEVDLPETFAWDNDGGFEKDYDPDSECSMALIPRIDARTYLESLGLKVKP